MRCHAICTIQASKSLKNYFMFMSVLPAWMSVPHVPVWCPWRSEEVHLSAWTWSSFRPFNFHIPFSPFIKLKPKAI